MKQKQYIRLLLLLYVLLVSFACKKDPYDANSGTFTDKRDNHSYKWVKIGDQIWMAENLAYLPYLCAPDAQCGIYVYDYQGTGSASVNYSTYGCLYNWETALKICPEGWHLPSDEEWMNLELFLGMKFEDLDRTDIRGIGVNVGGKLKETGSLHWIDPNTGATNETGFSALPGGCFETNRFHSIGIEGYFWSADAVNHSGACRFFCNANGLSARWFFEKTMGLSIRCVKN
ncbi:MAG: fibrobacter succinogenes major paralogous domain-containing protein [Bacteroidota bacterium]|nr:fibrobacter succinogenes major paralogous domain-containing protein [Bacteroidota bacterium]